MPVWALAMMAGGIDEWWMPARTITLHSVLRISDCTASVTYGCARREVSTAYMGSTLDATPRATSPSCPSPHTSLSNRPKWSVNSPPWVRSSAASMVVALSQRLLQTSASSLCRSASPSPRGTPATTNVTSLSGVEL